MSDRFDESYYAGIWGGAHRHDYADEWIAQIKARVPPGSSILDAGCGCGYIVKRLREEGYDAWGLEVSDYILQHCCAPGHVLKGSVTDIPFRDGAFDLVFSNGLWPYVAENDVPQAAREIWRVGRVQLHNYEYSDGCQHMDHFVTWKPRAWWEAALAAPRVLVACPVHESKEYAFGRWVEAVKRIDWPNVEVLAVDNSAGTAFYDRWRERVPMIHVEPGDREVYQRMEIGYEAVRRHFLASSAAWWLSVDSDVIVPSSVVRDLLARAGGADWVCNYVPSRTGSHLVGSFDCSLLNRAIMETPFEGTQGVHPDATWWAKVALLNPRIVELRGLIPCEHLREPAPPPSEVVTT